MSNANPKVLQYLEEAHASEVALVRVLQSQIAVAPGSRFRTGLETHLDETRDHARRLQERIVELKPLNPVQTVVGIAEAVVGQAIALGKTPVDLLRGTVGDEKILKNAKDAAATEALEIATYTALEQLARSLDDEQTADLAASIRADEEKMLERILREIPTLTRRVIAAEGSGEATFDVSDTGAADAIMEAAAAVKDAADDAEDAVRTRAKTTRTRAKSTVTKARTRTKKAATDTADAAKAVVDEAVQEIEDTADEASRKVKARASKAADRVEDAADKAKATASRATSSAKKAADEVRASASEAADTAKDAAEKAGDRAQETAAKAGDQAKETLSDAADAAKETAEKAGDQAEKTAADAADGARSTARQARKVPGVARAEGAAKGAVATAADLPFARYDKLTADEIAGRLPKLSQVDLAKVDAYERKNDARKTITDRIETLQGDEPWPGFDELTAVEVRKALDAADADRKAAVATYERRHKARAAVLKAAEKDAAKS
jgi:ferritin-like metal-binding protein YciE